MNYKHSNKNISHLVITSDGIGIAIAYVWQIAKWLIFLPLCLQFMLADVIAWWLMECLPWVWMADVIADVIVSVLILLFCVGPHPIYG